ncbi:MAG: hypothetical protein Ta2D_10620 [Rickettsiales bacterium]|nr:MAG: hypothetical protein Ta2D_10620 [Rickettsiales bacterium]
MCQFLLIFYFLLIKLKNIGLKEIKMNLKVKETVIKSLLIFLSATFILFGIINYFDGMSDVHLIKINNKQITFNGFLTFLNNKRTQIIQTNPDENLAYFDSQDFISLSLQEFINESLFEIQVEKLGIKSPREIMFKDIYINKAFADNSGKFSPTLFKASISDYGYTEKMYLDILAISNGRMVLGQAINSTNITNNILTESLLKLDNQYYVVNIYTFPVKTATDNTKITDEEINEYYLNNKFTLPQKKDISFVEIDLGKLNITATDLEDIVLQAKNLDEIAEKYKLKKKMISNKPDDVSEDFMEFDEGTFSDIIHLKDNVYKIYYIEKVEQETTLTLEEATPEIKKILGNKNKIESAKKYVEEVEEQLKKGNLTNLWKFKVSRDEKVYRDDVKYEPQLQSDLFRIKKSGDWTKSYIDENNEFITFFEVKDIKQIKETNKIVTFDEMKKQIGTSYNITKIQLLQRHLLQNNKVVLNNKLLDSLFNIAE